MTKSKEDSKRSTSPRAPVLGLEDCLNAVKAIFEKEQHNSMSTETIAAHIGMSPNGGAFLTKLANLSYYGLLDRVSKGEYKVSDLAKSIILAENDDEAKDALAISLQTPKIFATLQAEFVVTGLPTQKNLTNKLIKQGFNQTTAGKVARAFLDSIAFSGSRVNPKSVTESDKSKNSEENITDNREDAKTSPISYKHEIFLGTGRLAIVQVPGDLTKSEVTRISKVLDALT